MGTSACAECGFPIRRSTRFWHGWYHTTAPVGVWASTKRPGYWNHHAQPKTEVTA